MATCKFYGQEWVTDPSNFNFDYARNRLRFILEQQLYHKISFDSFRTLLMDLNNAREQREYLATKFMEEIVQFNDKFSIYYFPFKKMLLYPQLVIESGILRIVEFITGHKYQSSTIKSLRDFLTNVRSKRTLFSKPSFTLHRARIFLERDYIFVHRTLDKGKPQLKLNESVLWNQQFIITVSSKVPHPPYDTFEVCPLGTRDLPLVYYQFNKKVVMPFPFPSELRFFLPLVIAKGTLDVISVPHFDITHPNYEVKITPYFRPSTSIDTKNKETKKKRSI